MKTEKRSARKFHFDREKYSVKVSYSCLDKLIQDVMSGGLLDEKINAQNFPPNVIRCKDQIKIKVGYLASDLTIRDLEEMSSVGEMRAINVYEMIALVKQYPEVRNERILVAGSLLHVDGKTQVPIFYLGQFGIRFFRLWDISDAIRVQRYGQGVLNPISFPVVLL